ncbi:gluconate:proton symporter [Staphylococcus gallinarum]|uniref:gluconate:proton symporter n=1 Tax=Staphylococcus gallinarum TaxID=1293 RepID=UPI000D1DEF47|nr:gluconate:proton symporter [Staphylococcus gallinarum]PTK92753.1 gluconate:proton symporter [Staphylococcus gallinarum]
MGAAITGILLLLTFILFVIFVMRGGNLTLGFLIMAILWTIIGLVPINVAIKEIYTEPVLKYGSTIVNIIFGSWFGRVLVDTGIAGSISRRTQTVGNRYPVVATILISCVLALIFSSSYGVGSAIAIGVIIFPIMYSIGVPKHIAVSVFTLSIGAAMYINNVLFVQFQVFFPKIEWGLRYQKFGFTAMLVQMGITIAFILYNRKKIQNGKSKLVVKEDENTEIKEVSPWTDILPILPVALNIILGWDAVPALFLSIIVALFATGNMKTYTGLIKMINNTAYNAISDIAGLIIMLFVLNMFQAAAVHAMADFNDVFKHIIPDNTLLLTVIMVFLAPLAYFRGPLFLYGAGAATASIFVSTGLFDQYFLYGLLVVPSMVGISACITQSWNLWAVQYNELDTKTFLITGLPWIWIATAINLFLAYFIL